MRNRSKHRATSTNALRHTFRIDVCSQTLIATQDLPAWIEKRTGKRMHRSAVWRWCEHGILAVGGERIKLPVLRLGSVRFCSVEALDWWVAALNGEGTDTGTLQETVGGRP